MLCCKIIESRCSSILESLYRGLFGVVKLVKDIASHSNMTSHCLWVCCWDLLMCCTCSLLCVQQFKEPRELERFWFWYWSLPCCLLRLQPRLFAWLWVLQLLAFGYKAGMMLNWHNAQSLAAKSMHMRISKAIRCNAMCTQIPLTLFAKLSYQGVATWEDAHLP